jgi:hypothetical protein
MDHILLNTYVEKENGILVNVKDVVSKSPAK